MMGMHGEAWVNHAIQEADLLIALGMRFDDRVTGNLETYAPQRARRSTSTSTRPRSTRTCASTSRSSATCATTLDALLPRVAAGDRAAWLARIDELKGDAAVRDIQNAARRRPPATRRT